jgi:hypothetical protein
MPGSLDKIKQVMAPMGRGLLGEAAPGFAGGVIVELFHEWKITDAKVREDVKRNRSLWAEMAADDRKQLGVVARQVGNLDFITPELIIESIAEDFPAVASLFINSPQAGQWLAQQVDDLKEQVSLQSDQQLLTSSPPSA